MWVYRSSGIFPMDQGWDPNLNFIWVLPIRPPKTGPELELTPDFGVWTDNCFFHVGPSCFLVLMDPFLSLTVTFPSNVI